METLTCKSLVVGALCSRHVQEMRAFAEDRREEHILEIGRIEAQMDLVNHCDSADDLLRALVGNHRPFLWEEPAERPGAGFRADGAGIFYRARRDQVSIPNQLTSTLWHRNPATSAEARLS